MPVPFLIPALWAITLGGAAAGACGLSDQHEAGKTAEEAQSRLDNAVRENQQKLDQINARLASYRCRQDEVQGGTLADFAQWLADHAQQIKLATRPQAGNVDALNLVEPDLPNWADFGEMATAGLGALLTSMAAPSAVMATVSAFGTAGTGVAISSLSGAAATNATLASIGGGTLAAGGGGVAAGGAVLTGVALAPAVALAGIALAVQGEKALTQAAEYAAEVEVLISQMHAAEAIWSELRKHVDQLRSVVDDLDARARASLRRLANLDFDPAQEAHRAQLWETALLMRSLGEVIAAPVHDASGRPSSESRSLVEEVAA